MKYPQKDAESPLLPDQKPSLGKTTLELLFFVIFVGFGTPQLGQVEASVETFLLHSLQGLRAMPTPQQTDNDDRRK